MSDALTALFGGMHRGAASATVGRAVTYRLFVSSKKNLATGATVDTYHDVAVHDAVLTSVDAREVVAGGPLQVGDRRYELDGAVLAGEVRHAAARGLSTQDRIVDGLGSYRVVTWDDARPVLTVTVRR